MNIKLPPNFPKPKRPSKKKPKLKLIQGGGETTPRIENHLKLVKG